MGAAHEAQLRLGVGILPHDGIAVLHPLELRVVDDVNPGVLRDQALALFLGLRGQSGDVVQAHRAVGGGGRAEVLQIRFHAVVQLGAQPGVHALDVGHLLHDLHADGAAQQLRLGTGGAAHLHHPSGLAARVGQQAELRHKARNAAHQLQNPGVAVAPGAQHGVGVHYGGGFRPGQHVTLLGDVAHLVHIAGAGIGVVADNAQLLELLFVPRLLGIHDLLEHHVLQKAGGDVFVQRAGIGGEALAVGQSGGDQLVVQVVHRLHHVKAEADDRVAVLTGDGHHPLRAEGVAVHDQCFDHLGHDLALFAVKQRLLLGSQDHGITSFLFDVSIVPVCRWVVKRKKSTPPRCF